MTTIGIELLAKLETHLQKDYAGVAHVAYYPPTRGQIENCRYGILAMRANSNGLYYLVDGRGNAFISQELHYNLQETNESLVSVLGDWEQRTGNIV